MKFFHLDFALFLAFVIFLFNFIPNVGSIIAMSFAFALSLIQFDSYSSSLFMFALLVSIDMGMGNIVEPQFMGNRLNLSPLVIIISLVFWGTIW